MSGVSLPAGPVLPGLLALPPTPALLALPPAPETQAAASSPPLSASPAWRAALRERLLPVLQGERARWVFIGRAVLATLAALWLSLFLQLQQPGIAMTTVLVVMQPQSGAVLAKGFFRVLGTIAAGMVAVVVFSLFRQQPPLYVVVLALVSGACAYGAAKSRDMQRHGFIIAGFTVCLIGLPQLSGDADIFNASMLRCSEVLVGIVCTALVGDVVFPDTVSRAFDIDVKGRFTALDDFVGGMLSTGSLEPEKAEQKHLEFIRAVTTLQTHGASIAFEAANAVGKKRIQLFTTDFMAVTSSFHSLLSFLGKMDPLSAGAGREFFREYGAKAARALSLAEEAAPCAYMVRVAALARVQKEIGQLARSLAAAKYSRRQNIAATGAYLFSHFLTDMRNYLRHYAALTDKNVTVRTRRAFTQAGTDTVLALVTGMKTTLVFLLLALLWWGSGSDNGSTATVYAVAFCSALAASPHPAKSVYGVFKGCLLGSMAGFAYVFLVLPHIPDVFTLTASLAPFVAFGPCLATFFPQASYGNIYSFTFMALADPGLSLNILPVALADKALEQGFGIMMAGIILAVVLPPGGGWWKRRLAFALSGTLRLACRTRLSVARPTVEAHIRDILLQFSASPFVSSEEKQDMLRKALVLSQMSQLIMDLRWQTAQKGASAFERRSLPVLPGLLAAFFESPSADRRLAIIMRLDRSLNILENRYHGGFYSHALHANSFTLLYALQECFGKALFLFPWQDKNRGAGRCGHAA